MIQENASDQIQLSSHVCFHSIHSASIRGYIFGCCSFLGQSKDTAFLLSSFTTPPKNLFKWIFILDIKQEIIGKHEIQ